MSRRLGARGQLGLLNELHSPMRGLTYNNGSRSGLSMNQMRYDWLSDRWVIFAPNRLSRPDDFATPLQAPPAVSTAPCPFCRGYEKQTPNPTLVLRPAGADPSSEEWLVRVVPNKFPAVTHTDHHCSDEHDCSGDNQCSGHHQYSSQSRHSGESQRSELARVGVGLAGVGEDVASS